MKIFHILLSLPFIVTPFLISSKFIDHALLIKKFSVFFIFSIIAIVGYFLKSSQNKLNPTFTTIIKFLLLYIFFQMGISFLISTNISESLWGILYLISWICIYIFIAYYIQTQHLKTIIISTAIIGGFLSLLVYNDILNIISLNIPSSGKLSATFGYKNFFAQYLCFVIPASICSIYLVQSNYMKVIMIISTLLSSGALVITRTRAAWIAIFIMIIIFIILNLKKLLSDLKNIFSKKIVILIITTITLCVSLIVIKPIDIQTGIWIGNKSNFKNTLLSIKEINKKSTWGHRIDLYESSIRMIKNNFMFGVGLGNWKVVYPGYSNNDFIKDSKEHLASLRPHNDLLWIFSEVGFVGFVLFICFLMTHFKILLTQLKVSRNSNYYINLFCLLSLTAILIESLLDFPSERVLPNLFIWTILGYIISSKKTSSTHISFLPIICALIFISATFFISKEMHSHIYNQKIIEYRNKNQFKKMKESCLKSKDTFKTINHNAIPIDYYLSTAYQYLGEHSLSEKSINSGLNISPYNIGLLVKKMDVFIKSKDFEKAYLIMNQIKSIYPKLHGPQLKLAKECLKSNNMTIAKMIINNIDENNNKKIETQLKNLHFKLDQ